MPPFFIPGGDSPEVFQTVDGTLDDIAPLVIIGIKGRWTAAATTTPQAYGFCILALGADTLDAPALNQLAGLACAVGAVYPQTRRALSWTARSRAANTNGVEYGSNLRDIGALTGSDHQGEWTCIAVHT